MGHGGLSLIYLERALQLPGCPICRCCAQHQQRYLQWLVWENVNDAGTRVRLAQSLGFCGPHARQMLQVERDMLDMTLGNSIIYDSLIQITLSKVRHVHALLPARKPRRSVWRRLLDASHLMSPRMPRELARPLQAAKGCRACELGGEVAVRYAGVLLDMMSEDSARALYEQSDGICLPHLRIAVQASKQGGGLDCLLEATEKRLTGLREDLESLGWKHGSRGRREPLLEREACSVDRAIDFLTGSVMTDPYDE